jgi:hypothetical protein
MLAFEGPGKYSAGACHERSPSQLDLAHLEGFGSVANRKDGFFVDDAEDLIERNDGAAKGARVHSAFAQTRHGRRSQPVVHPAYAGVGATTSS